MVSPSEDAIRKQMEQLIPKIDINDITIKQFVKMLSNKMGAILKEKKNFIRNALTEILDQMEQENENESSSSSSEEESSSSSGEEDVKEEAEKTKSVKNIRKVGILAEKKLSPQLAAFIGKPQESRPQVVKALWKYFKEKDLQNPNDKRQIFLDKTLKAVFNVDQFTMFTLNKYVGAHIEPFQPVNLEELSENSKKKKKRKAEVAKNAKGKKDPKKRKSGTQPPFRLSDDLAKVVGKSILPRPQVTQALWVYIKENNLQVRKNSYSRIDIA